MELIGEELKPGSIGAKLASEILRSSRKPRVLKELMIFARRRETPRIDHLNEPVNLRSCDSLREWDP